MKKSFYSHGKLLLTGEYLVLDGAQALAIPTQKGQWLFIEETDTEGIHWQSFDENGNCWFETNFLITEKELTLANDTHNDPIADTLLTILNSAKDLNPIFLTTSSGYTVESRLEFDREWGLGSSSTLINNIAQWAKVNAFELLENSFGGSGYDIACAQNDTPIIYKRTEGKPVVTEAPFDPVFKNNLFFVYLNQKQDSKDSIKRYQSLPLKEFDKAEAEVNAITQQMLECTDLAAFEELISTHEAIVSKIIKTETVRSRLFSDYPGSIKSLGGWGGDFVLATGSSEDMDYFKKKGYTTVVPYEEMLLS